MKKITWNLPNLLSLEGFLAPLVLLFLTFRLTFPVYRIESWSPP